MTRGRLPAIVLVAAMLTTGLAGCIGTDDALDEQSVDDAADDALTNTRGWSSPSTPAEYDVLPGVQAFLESADGTEISVGVWLPKIPGCDWNSSELPEDCQLSTVLEGGPYFLDSVEEASFRPPKVEWFAQRGYAVVQMSLRGTGESGGCYQFKNPADVQDIDATIDWIAEQAWSDGDVGMIGRSYDGTAAWSGAASGNPHLKTIVPISGAVDGPHLYYKNGTSEQRGFIQPAGYYLYAYGLAAADPTYRVEDYPETACPEAAEDWIQGPLAGATGDASNAYWQSRDLTDDILADYNGSAWVIHGMKDWNVNPSQAVPFTKEMRDAGIETRAWFGQWGHAYPDRVDEHRNVRWDWADQLLAWFDFYLEGEGDEPWLGVEVEDSLYTWRQEESFPPPDVEWTDLEFHGDRIGAGQTTTFTSDPLEDDLRVSGLPRLHAEAIPTSATGGWVFAELYDLWPDGTQMRLGWAAMDLRYHAGGNTDPATLTPGEPIVAKMQFEPMDAHVAQGHQLHLVLHKDGVEDIPESPDQSPVLIGESTLSLPTIERDVTVTAPHGVSPVGDEAPAAPYALPGSSR